MRCFGDVFEKNIDVDVFGDVLKNAKHRANDAYNDVHRPPLVFGVVGWEDGLGPRSPAYKNILLGLQYLKEEWMHTLTAVSRFCDISIEVAKYMGYPLP